MTITIEHIENAVFLFHQANGNSEKQAAAISGVVASLKDDPKMRDDYWAKFVDTSCSNGKGDYAIAAEILNADEDWRRAALQLLWELDSHYGESLAMGIRKFLPHGDLDESLEVIEEHHERVLRNERNERNRNRTDCFEDG